MLGRLLLSFRLILALLLTATAFAEELQVGTAIPVMLNSELNSRKDEAGKKIDGKVMQEVLLKSGGKISKGARVSGHVVSVAKPAGSGANIVIKFDSIDDREGGIPVTAAALAVASPASVAEAQVPINNTASGQDSSDSWVTRQVGGDIVNRQQHAAGTPGGAIGTWLEGSSVLIKLTPNPDAGCPDGPGYRGAQAVWIFSSSACGTYGLNDVVVVSSGAADPVGSIILGSSENVMVRSGSGWLLLTVAAK
jgi:hypothetical protein